MLASTRKCANGDAKASTNGPLIFWEGEWTNICGHRFWDDDIGAKLFCNKIGYEQGVVDAKETVNEQKNFRLSHIFFHPCAAA